MTRRARFVASKSQEETVDTLVKSATAGNIPVSRQLIRTRDETVIDIIYDETIGHWDNLKTLLGQLDDENLLHHYDFVSHDTERTNADNTEADNARAHALHQKTGDGEARNELISKIVIHKLNVLTAEKLGEMSDTALSNLYRNLVHRGHLINAYVDSNPDVSMETAKELSDRELRRNLIRKSARQRNGNLA